MLPGFQPICSPVKEIAGSFGGIILLKDTDTGKNAQDVIGEYESLPLRYSSEIVLEMDMILGRSSASSSYAVEESGISPSQHFFPDIHQKIQK